jgi:hypothetical protein
MTTRTPCGEIVEWSPERRFGRFPRKKGEGATKTVYEACDLREGTLVAWSEISTELLSKEERARVNAEVALLEKINHVGIINFFATWSTQTKVVLITALVGGWNVVSVVCVCVCVSRHPTSLIMCVCVCVSRHPN